ncbi:MAG TPA: hypothetical protein VF691_17165, partial [Cytophagaceae bacterium]
WTKSGTYMNFGTFLDKNGHFFDTVHFPKVALQYPLAGKGFYKIKGKVVLDFNYPIIEVERMEKLPIVDRYGKVPDIKHAVR